SPAPWNLQGGMDLHPCSCRLQLGPHAKSGDASDVGQGQSVVRRAQENLWLPADAAKPLLPFLPSQNRDAWRESKSSCPFFRSLLGEWRRISSLTLIRRSQSPFPQGQRLAKSPWLRRVALPPVPAHLRSQHDLSG